MRSSNSVLFGSVSRGLDLVCILLALEEECHRAIRGWQPRQLYQCAAEPANTISKSVSSFSDRMFVVKWWCKIWCLSELRGSSTVERAGESFAVTSVSWRPMTSRPFANEEKGSRDGRFRAAAISMVMLRVGNRRLWELTWFLGWQASAGVAKIITVFVASLPKSDQHQLCLY